jgi:hypothetical protein
MPKIALNATVMSVFCKPALKKRFFGEFTLSENSEILRYRSE